MPLTAEQRRQIEENRQKALAKKRSNESAGRQPIKDDGPSSSVAGAALPRVTDDSKTATAPMLASKSSTAAAKGALVVQGQKAVSAKFVLLDRTTFKVEMGFLAPAVSIFKTVQSGRYNATDRTWTFELVDHDNVARKLRALGPAAVHVDALPRWVMETFSDKVPTSTRCGRVAEELTGSIEPGLWDCLMPFQQDGVRYALGRRGRILLADDMGLGKTIQSLAVVSAYREKWPLLIVCPSSVRFTWKSAIIRWLPSVPEENLVVLTSGQDYLDLDRQDSIVVISYDLMARRDGELARIGFRVAIMDESHFIKNHKSQRWKALETILRPSLEHVVLLSGTPALSRPIELYTQISLVEPDLFKYVTDFGMRYCDGRKVSFGGRGGGGHYDFAGSSNMGELRLMMEERFMLRRLKSDVLAQLPAKQREMVILDPSLVKAGSGKSATAVAMRNGAQMMRNASLSKQERRGVLLEWFSSTSEAKAKAVLDYLKDLLEGGQKFLCFAHHQTMIDKIGRMLEQQGVRYIRIDGSTPSEARKSRCDDFQTSEWTRVALLSITAANAGLTLTAAQLVIFAELFWNPGILTQAEDRAHRIGQTDSVTVRYLVALGTADDELWPMIQKKLDVLNKAGLSKDNFLESKSDNVRRHASNRPPPSGKITDYLSHTQVEKDLDGINWDDEVFGETTSGSVVDPGPSGPSLQIFPTNPGGPSEANLDHILDGINFDESFGDDDEDDPSNFTKFKKPKL